MPNTNNQKLKILMAHNYYQQPGGEDGVFAAEVAMLRENGHSVIEYTDHNDRIKKMNPLAVFGDTLWSSYTYKRFVKLIEEEKPDIAHFHNTFPLISPSAYYACKKMGVPVVQTLHNYRLLCPGALFYRDGKICEECIGNSVPLYQTLRDYEDNSFQDKASGKGGKRGLFSFPAGAVLHKCYHKSYLHSFVVSFMLFFHRFLGTWDSKVDAYIALTEFCKRKFVEGGLPEEKIFVKPNFVHPDPGMRESFDGDYALFVGRLSEEKGVRALLRAWEDVEGVPLKIVGDGPLRRELEDFVRERRIKDVEFLGKRGKDEVYSLMKGAGFLVFPSEWYETFGLVVIEAFACGVPVVAAGIGAMSEIIVDKYSGLHFMVGNKDNLNDVVRNIFFSKNLQELRNNCRQHFEFNYISEINYDLLINIYQKIKK